MLSWYVQDKWTCETCGELNYPLRRHCDRCWALRHAWLPLKRRVKKATLNTGPDDSSTNQRVVIPTAGEVLGQTRASQSKPTCTLSSVDTPPIETVFSSDRPPLVANDSGLGSSLTSLDMCGLDSGISSQEVQDLSTGSPADTRLDPSLNHDREDEAHKPVLHAVTHPGVTSPSAGADANQETNSKIDLSSDKCVVCLTKPKEASIVHGKTGHQVCCYVCAKRLKRRGKRCPVCRRSITMVIRNYLV